MTRPDPSKIPPAPLDLHLGQRIRARRKAVGISLADLAAVLGVGEDSLERMECGRERVGAQRLRDLARCLDVPFGYFFDGIPRELDITFSGTPLADVAPDMRPEEDGDETLCLIRAYLAIQDKKKRRLVHQLALDLGDAPETD